MFLFLLCILGFVFGAGFLIYGLFRPKKALKYLPEKKQSRAYVFLTTAIIWFISVVIMIIGATGNSTKDAASSKQMAASSQTVDLSVKTIEKTLGVNDEQAKTMSDEFNSVGIKNITGMSKEDDGTYSVTNDDIKDKIVVLAYVNSDNQLEKIALKGTPIWENGQVEGNLKQSLVDDHDEEMASRVVRDAVKKELNDPDSAKFDDREMKIMKTDNIITVVGTVRAKNAFGAMVANHFVVKMDASKDYAVTGVEFK